MEIVKNKRKSICRMCRKQINSDYKVSRRRSSFHLRCYYGWVGKILKRFKEENKKLGRYKKHMVLEALEE